MEARHFFAQQSIQNVAKICIVGDQGVGKTSMIRKYSGQLFDKFNSPTIGSECTSINASHIDQTFRLDLWDVAGDVTFRTLVPNFYRGSAVFILVYDITRRDTFENIDSWSHSIRSFVGSNADHVIMFLCGNKCDLMKERKVTTEEGQKLAENSGMNFYETSAKAGESIPYLFWNVCRHLRTRAVRFQRQDSLDLGDYVVLRRQEVPLDTNPPVMEPVYYWCWC